jgi:hypothetical protein
MKTFFYMGRNLENQSGVSWKIWRIECQNRKVTAWWGPADLVARKVKASRTLQSKVWTLPSAQAAREFEAARIKQKLNDGYERKPKRG